MKKTLIALAITGAMTGLANAQSNVVIYGVVDTGFIKENDLKVFAEIFQISARLIVNKASYKFKNAQISGLTQKLINEVKK